MEHKIQFHKHHLISDYNLINSHREQVGGITKNKISIFDESEKNYKKLNKEINKIFDTELDYEYDISLDQNNIATIILKYNNKNIVSLRYELAGVYNTTTSIWYWAWNIDGINRTLTSETLKLKKILKGLVNNNQKYESDELDQLYFYIKNGNFHIQENLDIFTKIILFLSKQKWLLKINGFGGLNKDQKIIQYLFIKDVVQQY